MKTNVNVDLAAVQNPAHPAHHFHLGQFMALVLMGLQAYQVSQSPVGAGAGAFLNPATIAPYLAGVVSIFQTPVTDPRGSSVQA